MDRFLKSLSFIVIFLLNSQYSLAIPFIDIKKFHCDGILGEGPIIKNFRNDKFSYYHDMPYDFEVPFDKVNHASLSIDAYWVDDNKDVVEVNGTSQGTLNSGGSYRYYWDWSSFSFAKLDNPSVTVFDISSIFFNWPTGQKLEVTVNPEGDFCDFIIQISSSKLTLDYENVAAHAPEPSAMLLMGMGLFLISVCMRKKYLTRG